MTHLLWTTIGGALLFAHVLQLSAVAMVGFGGGYNNLYPEYQQEQTVSVYKLPTKRSDKMKAFIECRPDCRSKCDHRLYAMVNNKNSCHTCLLECISAFTEQADKLGIKLDGKEKKKDSGKRKNRQFKRKLRHDRLIERPDVYGR